MAKLEITQSHNVTAEEAKSKLDALSKELSDKYGIASKWTSDTEAKVDGKGANGLISIAPKQVSVNLELNFAASVFKSKIEAKIKEELKKLFG